MESGSAPSGSTSQQDLPPLIIATASPSLNDSSQMQSTITTAISQEDPHISCIDTLWMQTLTGGEELFPARDAGILDPHPSDSTMNDDLLFSFESLLAAWETDIYNQDPPSNLQSPQSVSHNPFLGGANQLTALPGGSTSYPQDSCESLQWMFTTSCGEDQARAGNPSQSAGAALDAMNTMSPLLQTMLMAEFQDQPTSSDIPTTLGHSSRVVSSHTEPLHTPQPMPQPESGWIGFRAVSEICEPSQASLLTSKQDQSLSESLGRPASVASNGMDVSSPMLHTPTVASNVDNFATVPSTASDVNVSSGNIDAAPSSSRSYSNPSAKKSKSRLQQGVRWAGVSCLPPPAPTNTVSDGKHRYGLRRKNRFLTLDSACYKPKGMSFSVLDSVDRIMTYYISVCVIFHRGSSVADHHGRRGAGSRRPGAIHDAESEEGRFGSSFENVARSRTELSGQLSSPEYIFLLVRLREYSNRRLCWCVGKIKVYKSIPPHYSIPHSLIHAIVSDRIPNVANSSYSRARIRIKCEPSEDSAT